MIIKTYDNNEWKIMSPWIDKGIKMHPHIIADGDPMRDIIENGVGNKCQTVTTYLGDYLITLNNTNAWVHSGIGKQRECEKVSRKVVLQATSSDYAMAATNGVDIAIKTSYDTEYYYYINYEKDWDENDTTDISFVRVTNPTRKAIGCCWNNGVFYIIGTDYIYYSTDALNWNSIAVPTKTGVDLTGCREHDFAVCSYGDYDYLFGCSSGTTSSYGVVIKISKTSNSVVDVYLMNDSEYINTLAIVPMEVSNGLGSLPVIVFKDKSNSRLSFAVMNISDKDIPALTTYKTSIITGANPTFVGYDMGKQQIAFMYKSESTSCKFESIIVNLKNTSIISINEFDCMYSYGKPQAINTEDYFGFICYRKNSNEKSFIASASNGINWKTNLGSIYVEDIDRNKVDVSDVVSSYFTREGNTWYFTTVMKTDETSSVLKLPSFINPKIVIGSCNSYTTSYTENNSDVKIEDGDGISWTINSSCNDYKINTEKIFGEGEGRTIKCSGTIKMFHIDTNGIKGTRISGQISGDLSSFGTGSFTIPSYPIFSIEKTDMVLDGNAANNPLVVKWMVIE